MIRIRADLHTHALGDGRFGASAATLVAALVDAAVEVGLQCLAVTDHDDLRPGLMAADYATTRGLPLLVVPGMEVTTGGGHLVVIGIDAPVRPWQLLAETIAQARAYGALTVLPHPFFPNLRQYTRVDAIERFNARYGDFEVGSDGPALVADSDAHSASDLRASSHYTVIEATELSWPAITAAIHARRVTAV